MALKRIRFELWSWYSFLLSSKVFTRHNDENSLATARGVWKQSKVRVTGDDIQVEIVHLDWDLR